MKYLLLTSNQVAASPASSPMPSNTTDYDPIMRFKQEHEQSNSGYVKSGRIFFLFTNLCMALCL